MQFLERQIGRIRRFPKRRVVFPEGDDPRVKAATERLSAEGLIEPILLHGIAEDDLYGDLLYERRRAKGISRAEAAELARLPLYRAALMVAAGDADGAVGGAVNTTADTVRAALYCIGLRAGIRTVSGVFFMCPKDREALAFADCAMVVDPTAEEVAEIAISTAESVRSVMGVEPVVALLSYSTKGSASGARIDKMVEALRIVREREPGLCIDGEMQVDAALVEAVGLAKAPGSVVSGRANTLVFPSLESANIGYKLVERLGGASAYGPFLQGLAKPMNDLSRGCSADDVYGVAVITALQVGE